jgi:Ca2+-transporting ATPase
VINGPVLQDAFDTRALPLQTWLLVAGVALTIVPVLELARLMLRRASPSS